jgi:hypothetical protein
MRGLCHCCPHSCYFGSLLCSISLTFPQPIPSPVYHFSWRGWVFLGDSRWMEWQIAGWWGQPRVLFPVHVLRRSLDTLWKQSMCWGQWQAGFHFLFPAKQTEYTSKQVTNCLGLGALGCWTWDSCLTPSSVIESGAKKQEEKARPGGYWAGYVGSVMPGTSGWLQNAAQSWLGPS